MSARDVATRALVAEAEELDHLGDVLVAANLP